MLLRGLVWGAPSPSSLDPVHRIAGSPEDVQLIGRVESDARRWSGSCSVLLAVEWIDGRPQSGRTELVLRPCPTLPLQGWRVRVQGTLRRPSAGLHPLLPGAAERLAARGSWSRLTSSRMEVIGRAWSPIADLRQIFHVAGLSHALASSGFHLSVLMGAALALSRRWRAVMRLILAFGAMLLFLVLAGHQPSVVRAVLMGSMALLIRETGNRSRGFGVLLVAVSLMLLAHPAWARSIGFQLSAAATAGLLLTSPALERWLKSWLPHRSRALAPALAVPLAAMAWTLPLQLLHFGSTPLYALVANVLAAPLLTPLTLAALLLALLSLFLPSGPLLVLSWPVSQLAGVLIGLVRWISQWPSAQLLTGHPQPWVVALLAVGLIPWLLPDLAKRRRLALLPLLLTVLVQGVMQCRDELVVIQRHGDHWLLARHRGRGALISTAGHSQACRTAVRLSEAYGHQRLDWVMLLDGVATDAAACWRQLARRLQAPQQGQPPLRMGQVLLSDGLELHLLADRGQPLLLRLGDQRWHLFPKPQALWALQEAKRPMSPHIIQGHWLGFRPSAAQRRWLSQNEGEVSN